MSSRAFAVLFLVACGGSAELSPVPPVLDATHIYRKVDRLDLSKGEAISLLCDGEDTLLSGGCAVLGSGSNNNALRASIPQDENAWYCNAAPFVGGHLQIAVECYK